MRERERQMGGEREKHEIMQLCCIAMFMRLLLCYDFCREKGGAYGSGATAADGVFTFYSYRYLYNLLSDAPRVQHSN